MPTKETKKNSFDLVDPMPETVHPLCKIKPVLGFFCYSNLKVYEEIMKDPYIKEMIKTGYWQEMSAAEQGYYIKNMVQTGPESSAMLDKMYEQAVESLKKTRAEVLKRWNDM
jgi:hypothetical protein